MVQTVFVLAFVVVTSVVVAFPYLVLPFGGVLVVVVVVVTLRFGGVCFDFGMGRWEVGKRPVVVASNIG